MPIQAECPKCGRRLRVTEAMAGKKGKCPNCSAVFPLTPPKKHGWYVQTPDGGQRGPLAQAELAGLDPFCQVRREDWVEWKWAEDVLPKLALTEEAKPPADDPREEDATPSLTLCPDCGKTVSVRAGQCPHCGCPATDVTQRGTPVAALADSPTDVDVRPRGRAWKRNLIVWIGAGCAVMTIASVLIVLFVILPIWRIWQSADELLSQSDQIFDLPVEPPLEPPPGPSGLLDPDAAKLCLDEASAAHARRLDDYFREAHLASSLVGQLQASAQLYQSIDMEALARGDLTAIPEVDPQPEPERRAEPYRSRYEPMLADCMTYVAKEVPVEQAERDAIWAAAAEWEQARRDAFDKLVTDRMQLPLGP